MSDRNRKPTPAELAVERAMARGVMYEIERATGYPPRPRSAWPAVASAASWALVALAFAAAVAAVT